MKEQMIIIAKIKVILMVDKTNWPEDWDLKQELAHQINFDDALEYEVVEAVIVEP